MEMNGKPPEQSLKLTSHYTYYGNTVTASVTRPVSDYFSVTPSVQRPRSVYLPEDDFKYLKKSDVGSTTKTSPDLPKAAR